MRTIKYLVKEITLTLIIILQITVFFYIWQKFEKTTYFNNINKAWAIMALYALVSVLVMKVFKVFHIGHGRLLDILFGEVSATTVTNIFIYLQLCMLKNYPYLYSIKVIGIIIIINSLLSCIILTLLQIFYSHMTPIQNAVLIMNKGSDIKKVINKKKRNDKLIDIKDTYEVPSGEPDCLLEIENIIRNYNIIIIDDLYPILRNNILKYCYENNKKCYSVTKTADILIQSGKMTYLGYRPVLMHNTKELLFFQGICKRCLDILISLLGLMITSPILLISAILIKLTDKGPIFFIQDRYTKNKKIFKIYKFRSMYINTSTSDPTLKNDRRITPIGKVLRRTHVDELPQLINVLKGEMSIVGPRPEMKEIYDKYENKYPEYRYRLKVKAGLTGYAQIYGKYDTSPKDKLKFDMYYICNYSLLLDLKLMLLTFKIIFMKDTSEGRES